MFVEAAAKQRLRKYANLAYKHAQRAGRPIVAAVTLQLNNDLDPALTVMAARQESERWTVYEQRQDPKTVIATLGLCTSCKAEGSQRFEQVADQWEQISADAVFDAGSGVLGEGLIVVGGFAFDDFASGQYPWQEFESSEMYVPTISIAKDRSGTRLTAAVLIEGSPDFDLEGAVDSVVSRCEAIGLVDCGADADGAVAGKTPTCQWNFETVKPQDHYLSAVQSAVQLIRKGEFEKIVLARSIRAQRQESEERSVSGQELLTKLRDRYPGCCELAVGHANSTLVAATPELLVRRSGARVNTLALAGTTTRSGESEVDHELANELTKSTKDIGEHQIVVERIVSRLQSVCLWAGTAEQPEVVSAGSVQHLATPIRAQLKQPLSVIRLAGLLHPTPAVGGFPESAALPQISRLEELDRGWYAGPVGWCDVTGDGEFSVTLRCALVNPEEAFLFGGVGVVAASEPQSELAETESKISAMSAVLRVV